ncbi:MAG: hypothetical protein ACT4NY_11560 [Pseudonocardiales bacterium]
MVTAYPMRGRISRPKWNDTIRGCKKSLWLYGMAELGYALDDEVPIILEEAARAGCDIRNTKHFQRTWDLAKDCVE